MIAKKLSGEASAHELQELEDILKRNPELHYSLQTVIDLWHPGAGFDTATAHAAFNRHLQRMRELDVDFTLPQNDQAKTFHTSAGSGATHRRTRIIRASFAAAIVAIGLYVSVKHFYSTPVVVIQPSFIVKTVSEISTRNGSKTNMVLPDGTRVWLNAGSKLTYDKNFDRLIREVSLTGEAFFDVTHNAAKPFVIHTSKIDIRVLGTKFNVKSYPADRTTEATLIRGSIEVSFKNAASKKFILKPNQKIVVNNADYDMNAAPALKRQQQVSAPVVAVRNLTYYQHSNAIIETSWVENNLVFQDESFEDLGRQLERWYGVEIHFKNPETQQLHFTGNFTNESIVQALDALKLTANFSYSIDTTNITISK